MKKYIVFAVSLFAVGMMWANSFVLVYQDKEAIKQGSPWLGIANQEGIVIQADQALEAKTTPIVGLPNGDLRSSSLLRLDNQANVALVKIGEPIVDKELSEIHKQKAQALLGFFPNKETLSKAAASSPSTVLSYVGQEEGPFVIRLNGEDIGEDPIVLNKKGKNSEFRMEVVNVSTQSVWRVDLKLESNPPISFWKKGRKKGLNDVPRRTFRYGYQSMFKPFKENATFSIPLEAFYVKGESYEWTVSFKSKIGDVTKKIPIKFKQVN